MNKKDFDYLYDYNRWANARVLDSASKLTPDQFTRDLQSSHRSVRDTLVHLLAAEWIWLERWNGTSPKALLDPAEFPTIESIRKRWREVEEGYKKFINQVREESLGEVITYTNTKGEQWAYPLAQMFQHVMNHATYHRGQVTTMLRQLGAEATPLDLLVYMDVTKR
ncbi:MAG TPA: DinB family protein [Blastocatellia bacterium]|nr:DinB family protein [Blastocatellia bacterium]